MFSCRAMGMNVKRMLNEGVTVQTEAEMWSIWSIGVTEKKRFNVLEVWCMRSMYGVYYMD